MKEKGRFPARFEDKVKARLVVDMNTETAFELARTGDFYETRFGIIEGQQAFLYS